MAIAMVFKKDAARADVIYSSSGTSGSSSSGSNSDSSTHMIVEESVAVETAARSNIV